MPVKRWIVFLLCLTVCMSALSGCGTGKEFDSSSKKLNVVTTIFPYYDFVRQIGKIFQCEKDFGFQISLNF